MPSGKSLYNLRHLEVLRMHAQGYSNTEVATACAYTPQAVSDIINSETGKDVLGQIFEQRLSTIMEVQTVAQMIAPECLNEKIQLALKSRDERIRSTNCKDILEIAGHSPQRTIVVEKSMREESNLAGKTEKELRDDLLKIVGMESTIH